MINLYFKNFNFNLSNSIGIMLFTEYEKEIFIKRLKGLNLDYKSYSFSNLKARFNLNNKITSPLEFPLKDINKFLSSKIIILDDVKVKSLWDAVLFNAVCDFILNNEIIFCMKAIGDFKIENLFSAYLNYDKNSYAGLILDVYKLRFKLLISTRIVKNPKDCGYTPSMASIVNKINSCGFGINKMGLERYSDSCINFSDKRKFKIRIKIVPLKKIINAKDEFISKNEISINTSLSDIYFYPDELIKKIKVYFIIAGNIRKPVNRAYNAPKIQNTVHNYMSEIQNLSLRELDSPHLVIAGAGSGKTRMIVEKFLYLLNSIPYDSILVLTFTNNAVNEIKSRIFSGLKIKEINNNLIKDKILNISTYHSFFYSIIKEFYKELGFESIPLIKENNASYENDNRIFITYDEIILYVLKLFKNDAIVYDIAARFKYILIDEYQDLDFLSDYIIKKLDFARGAVMYAGDDDQAIYRFNGGDSFNILFFDLFFPSGKVFVFQNNYRSDYKIIDFCNSILGNIAFRYPKKLAAKNQTNGSGESNIVNFLKFKNKNLEEEFVKKTFNEFISQGKSAGILTRTQKEAEHFKTILGEFYPDNFSYYTGGGFIGTIHRSKGLEFDIVFIANVVQGNMPHLKSMAQTRRVLRHPFIEFLDTDIKLKTGEGDEIKLFYVAVSRAKEKVFISYSGKISEFLPE